LNNKLIIGITGASGSIYGKLLLEKLVGLSGQLKDVSVIFSNNARTVWAYELGSIDVASIPFTIYKPDDFFAPMASGSAGYTAMIICPCSMGTLGRIASGVSDDLMARAADVILKEKRRLVLVPREAPYNLIHLSNMKLLTEAGAVICPASPSFYSKPATINDVVMTIVDRALTLAGLEVEGFHWGSRSS
jgi:4-hydroxy-3-polyprenylbenzoate decarboxylase